MRSSNEEQIYHLQPAHFSVAESCIEDLEGARSSLLHYWAVKLAAPEVTALTTCELWVQIICIKNPTLQHSLLLTSVCSCNPCWDRDSKSQKHEEECYFYLLAWKFWVSFTTPDLDAHLRLHRSWSDQHNLRCWSLVPEFLRGTMEQLSTAVPEGQCTAFPPRLRIWFRRSAAASLRSNLTKSRGGVGGAAAVLAAGGEGTCRRGRTQFCHSPACRDSHPHIPDKERKIFFSLGGYCGKQNVQVRPQI